MEPFQIYYHKNKTDGKGYVGQAENGRWEKRWKEHIYAAFHESKKYFHKAIKKYGPENFEHSIVEEVETQEQADLAEIKWIADLKTLDCEWGYNHTKGGSKTVHTEISRKKNSDTKLRMFQEDPTYAQRISQSLLGREVPLEARQKSSITNIQRYKDNPELAIAVGDRKRGIKYPPEYGAKISAAKLASDYVQSEETIEKKRQANLAQADFFRQKNIEQFSDPVAREEHSKLTKNQFNNPIQRENHRIGLLISNAVKRVEKKLAKASLEFHQKFETIDTSKINQDIVDALNSLLVSIQVSLGEKPYVPKRRQVSFERSTKVKVAA